MITIAEMNQLCPAATALYFSLVAISKPGRSRLWISRRRIIERTGFRNKTSISKYLKLLVKGGWITKHIKAEVDSATKKVIRRHLIIYFRAPKRWPDAYPVSTPRHQWIRLIDKACMHRSVGKRSRDSVKTICDWMKLHRFPIPFIKSDAYKQEPLPLSFEKSDQALFLGSGPAYREGASKQDVFIGIKREISGAQDVQMVEASELSSKLAKEWKCILNFSVEESVIEERESDFTG